MLEGITLTDIVLFSVGFGAGIGVNYLVGKYVFMKLFKRQADAITLKSTAYFEAIQHVISYVIGFLMGGMMIAPELLAPIFVAWIALQTFLANQIFGFNGVAHGLTFVGIDTLTDAVVGAVFGQGAASLSFALIRMALMPL